MNCREEFQKLFSELCVISEEEKTYKGDIKWHIPGSEIEKYFYLVRADFSKNGKYAKIESSWLSIGSPSYCSFYISVYPCDYEVVTVGSPPKYMSGYNKQLCVSIIFNRKLPDCAWVKGEIYFEGLLFYKQHAKFSVSAKDFDRKIEFNNDNFTFYMNSASWRSGKVYCHCSIKVSMREVKCAFDNEKICYGESRNYDSAKETFKHDSLSDVKIRIDNHLFTTHKTLLTRINAFQDLFNDNESEQCFELGNIEPEIFKHILIFLYSGDIPKMSFKLACELYIVASDLKIYDLECLCSAYLGGNLTETNVTIVLKLSDEYKDIALKKECFKFIKRSDVETETLAENAIISVPSKNECR